MKSINLDEIALKFGAHNTREDGMCAMEAVAWLAGEPHSDAPVCTCPVITKYVIGLNDGLSNEDRQRLKTYLPSLIGTRDGNEVKRAEMLAMGVVTRVVPHVIEFAGFKERANKMRAAKDLAAANDATAEYATNAAVYAARTAVYAADYAASTYAATEAAAYAANAAVYAAVCASTAAESADVRKTIIDEAFKLLDEVIAVGADRRKTGDVK